MAAKRPSDQTPSATESTRPAAGRGSSRKSNRTATVSPRWAPQQRAQFVTQVVGGTRRAADLLDVAPSQASRWASGESVPDAEHARMLVDLDHVLAHALLVWTERVARDWLTTPNAHLDFIRPSDWIRMYGTAEVVNALQAEAAGAYA